MGIELEARGPTELATKEVKDLGGNLEGRAAPLTRHVTVVASGEVVRRGLMTIVRVVNNGEVFELFENAVDGGEGDIGHVTLHRQSDFFDGSVVPRLEQRSNNRSFRLGDPFPLGPQLGDDLFFGGDTIRHGVSLGCFGPRPTTEEEDPAEPSHHGGHYQGDRYRCDNGSGFGKHHTGEEEWHGEAHGAQ